MSNIMPETKKCVGRAFIGCLANMNTSPLISVELKYEHKR